jgi:hypothetical protein
MLKDFYFKNKKIFYIGTVTFFSLLFLMMYLYSTGNKIIVENTENNINNFDLINQINDVEGDGVGLPLNKITGTRCKNGEKRPYAVMLAADKAARPLSGVSEADVVIEMPVITDGITRYMAIFKCEEPKEIGSIRSSRHDFITLAEGFDAIYAHWGGSYLALNKLNNGVIDNIDALKNPNKVFYRKSNIAAPHNGFTSFKKLDDTANKLKYRQTTEFEGYPHTKDKSVTEQRYEINIGYPKPYNASFKYDPRLNLYYRSVGGFKEVDRNNNEQVAVKNIVIMEAKSRQVKGQYNDVDIENSGDATIYRNGEIVYGIWQKKSKKYYFLDKDKKEIEFVAGKIWISIVQPNEAISIKNL